MCGQCMLHLSYLASQLPAAVGLGDASPKSGPRGIFGRSYRSEHSLVLHSVAAG
jgi:hypothetical protein